MELKEIQYMLAIAECKSISKASEQLYIAQSSLSQFLKNYEAHCGYTFFTRTNRGLIPTKEGELYIETARKIYILQRNLNNQLFEMSALERGKVIFSLSGYRSPHLLPSLIPRFQNLYPGIELSILEASMEAQEQLLKKGESDVAFLCLPLKKHDIPYREIMKEEILLAVSPDFPFLKIADIHNDCHRLWIEPSTLTHQKFLLYSINHRLQDFAEQLFSQYHIHPHIVQSHNSFDTLIRLCETGMGLTFIPETYIDARSRLNYLSLGKEGMYRTLVLGYPPMSYMPNAVQVFSDVLIEIFEQKSGELQQLRVQQNQSHQLKQ